MAYIPRMNISNFDLNLLRVLDMLLREQNVSRAAERLALTQPTVSNALARLRDLLDDPLLVRVGRRMCPTPRALALEGPIRAALRQIEQTLGGGEAFEPQHSRRQLRIALTDFVEQLCMPALLARLQSVAPQLRIDVAHLTPNLPVEALDRGDLDMVLGRFNEVPARFTRQLWRRETLRIAVRREHPQISGSLDLQTFLQLRHLWVHGGQTRGMVDQWLAEQNLERQIVYTTPNYLQAAHLVAATDLCVVLPTQLAQQFAELLPLDLHELPFALEPFELDLVYLSHRQHDPALAWLAEQILAIAAP
ncbi:LysR family transcriptional regulator [Pseudomonas granadensis]|uniref:LysR family transcriptional regulator n=1 Tax=Pseudomonas granadensis TaxID=1421430 RepID=UPI0019D17642|nr:LysR family transcriptional regulator [Pseudomonas granadensis]MBN6776458.1 LysR family transcriptional regulator [Pseudomonas granadensis]MBN6807579.1 LysR family transcriptional regulator [Pseudomonas granadensis]MBN6834441.1 LysR family transcriptional regulator [Pseudomonas granadensis]MBN6841961.1 LysR family transcriptional regulator [Pseudomonas granadensis]MBN6870533.1 LysR family transcriptional regulator [Pseudomonas granadensis]